MDRIDGDQDEQSPRVCDGGGEGIKNREFLGIPWWSSG